MKKSKLFMIVFAALIIASMILAGCGGAATQPPATEAPPAATEAPPAETEAPPAAELSVGVVLPTKEEPRWLQDEARFKEAFDAAGYEVQILFSDGDSAKERTNVQTLISQGVSVIVITPHDGTAAAAAAAGSPRCRRQGDLLRPADPRDRSGRLLCNLRQRFGRRSAGASTWSTRPAEVGYPLYLYAGAATDNNAFLFFEGAWNVLQPKIADGTFVIKNSSEAVALQDKATLTRDEMAADHRSGDHRLGVRCRQEPGRSQPDCGPCCRQGRCLHARPQRRHRARHCRCLRR